MTDEEIKKLAEQYVKEVRYDDYFLEEATRVIRWLTKDHCIVEKSKVKEIDNIVCGTFSIGNLAVRQSWEYVKRKLFEEDKK